MLPPPPQGHIRTDDGRLLELRLQESRLRQLTAVLKPGDIVSGRVIESLDDGQFLFAIRGRNLIASSNLPLPRDAVVRFRVMAHGDQTLLQVIDAEGLTPRPNRSDQALTSDLAQRLHALRLPANDAGATVLRSFEDAGAPLRAGRMLQVAEQIASLPPQDRPREAAAQALLARAGLPAQNAWLGLARTIVDGAPNAAASWQRLTAMLTGTLAQNATIPSGRPPPASPPPNGLPAGTPGTPPPVAPPMSASPPITGVDRPTVGTEATTPPAVGTPPASTGNAPTTPPATNWPWPMPPPTGVNPALNLPDASSGQRDIMQLLLTLAGLRPRTAASADAHNETTARPPEVSTHHTSNRGALADDAPLLRQAATIAQHAPVDSDLRQSALAATRELAAETLIKPAPVQHYDIVLPLPLLAQHNPQPARLAVRNQDDTNGHTQTFIRIDAVLDGLGPLSLRMNGGDGMPLAITLFLSAASLSSFEPHLESLEADLGALGIDAALRLGDIAELDRDDA